MSTTTVNTTDDVNQNQSLGYSYTLDNTLSYIFDMGEDHGLDALIGQSAEKWGMGEGVSGGNSNTLFPGSWDHAWLTNTQGVTAGVTSVSGSPWGEGD